MKRRELLIQGTALLALQLVPLRSIGRELTEIARTYPGETINTGRVHLVAPALAENGNSVPLEVRVESPMTPADHVAEIRIFAEKNPVPLVATFRLSAASGRAHVTTRIRYGDSQTITAVARMSDGTLWSGTAKTIVTLAACVEPLI